MKLIRALLTLPIVIFIEVGMLIIMLVLAIYDSITSQFPRGLHSIKKHCKLIVESAKGQSTYLYTYTQRRRK